jgi:hypothetical protein
MKRRLIMVAAALLGLLLAVNAFGQDASLSGTVADATGGVVPGTTITATNDNTGVVSTAVTNASGVYSFPRLIFGVYTVKAEQSGFQPKIFTKVTLLAGQQARLNFQLEVVGVATNIEVSTSAERLLLESSSSVGDALSAKVVQELPLVNRNALDLVKVMSGVIMTDDATFAANDTTFAGVSATGVNIQRDGVMVNDVRWPTGVNAATRVNPDLVGEFRMVLAPVDAEIGRGNAQIQIVTKAGTNEYHGGVVWNVQNTGLDPNTWENNRNDVAPPWRNLHQYSGSIGGPIVKNKTFFFFLFDGQLNKIRTEYNALAMTPCAKRGVFRFWDRWNNANALYTPSAQTAGSADPQINSVDRSGNPLRPEWEPGSANWGVTPYTGQLRYASVFGTITNLNNLAPDCSNVQVTGTWDPLRPKQDPSGYIADFLERLPEANNYDIGDGLNAAGHRWARGLDGADNLFGVGEDTWRRQFNIRIDHNFNDRHRISGSWSYEKDWSDDSFKNWPDGYGGTNIRRPQVFSVNFISSVRPTLINEFRFGMSRTGTNVESPITNPDNGDEVKNLLAQFGTLPNDEISIVGPGMGRFSFSPNNFSPNVSNYFGGRGMLIAPLIDLSPRYSYGDTMSWVKNAHSLRFGGEYRRISSRSQNGWTFGYVNNPFGLGGELPLTPETFGNVVGDLAGSSANSGDKRAFRDLLVFQSGSLNTVTQLRFINEQTQTTWNNPVEDPLLDRDTIMHEFSAFFKDDWKIRPDLTLNLGVRWDYYGVPFIGNGMTVGLEGGGGAIFGPSGGFDNWFTPIKKGDVAPGELVNLRSIGPEGQNPDEMLYPKTWGNVGPAIGFAWQLPWGGKGKTTIRGGYQISYLGMAGNFSAVEAAAGQAPGTIYQNSWNNGGTWATGTYFGIKDLMTNALFANGIPTPANVSPGISTFTLYNRTQNISAFAPDYKYPYIQNLTFAVTRNLTSNLILDLRYIGTLTRRNFSTLNVNTANFLTNGLLEAFDGARRGEDPVLLDQLLYGIAPLPWGCTVNGTTCKGGEALRNAAFPNFTLPWDAAGAFTNLNQMLAMGNYNGLANAINALSNPYGAPGYTQPGEFIGTNGFPVNFIKASPQFSNANMSSNQGHSNYHSFQAQITLRPTKGLSFMSTYTWSKNLGLPGTFADPRNLFDDYAVMSTDRPHNWVTYGTYDLPFGPGKSFGASSSGALAHIIGNWQLGWITTVTSGSPMSISANCGLYGQCTPDEVGDGFDYDSAGVFWAPGAPTGSYFSERYTFTRDPMCNNVDESIRNLCTLQAVVDSKTGKIVLQNPLPGNRGNMGVNRFRNLTRWNIDMSASKSIMINETIAFRLRADFTNIFNHPFASGTLGGSGTRITYPTAPSMNINSSTEALGLYDYKVGGRTFQMMMRLDF